MQAPSPAALLQFRNGLKSFADFTDEEWSLFAQSLYCRSLRKKDNFITAGVISTEIAFILKGSLRFYGIKDGQEISAYFCFENELVASYAAFLKQASSPSTIEAMEDTEVICFSYNGLQKMLADARLAYRMERMGRLIAEHLICCYEERVASFLSQTPEERYLGLLSQSSNLLQRVPQHYIANFLGVTPVSLSRIRQRIAEKRLTITRAA